MTEQPEKRRRPSPEQIQEALFGAGALTTIVSVAFWSPVAAGMIAGAGMIVTAAAIWRLEREAELKKRVAERGEE